MEIKLLKILSFQFNTLLFWGEKADCLSEIRFCWLVMGYWVKDGHS